MFRLFSRVGVLVFALGMAANELSASPITVAASQGNLAASVTFDTSGTDLIVTLTNTSLFDVMVPADVLTGVFFDIGGAALSLGRTSAVLAPGSTVFFGPVDPGNVVGGEWAYKANVGGPGGRYYGISSAGLGLFGPGDRFPGSDLQPPPNVDGLQYGITSAGDNLLTGNSPVTGDNALIKNSVVFTLSGLPLGFDPSAHVYNILFQYGTGLNEPSFPEPSVAAPLLFSALLLVRRSRRA